VRKEDVRNHTTVPRVRIDSRFVELYRSRGNITAFYDEWAAATAARNWSSTHAGMVNVLAGLESEATMVSYLSRACTETLRVDGRYLGLYGGNDDGSQPRGTDAFADRRSAIFAALDACTTL
jgi:hypothetical protein